MSNSFPYPKVVSVSNKMVSPHGNAIAKTPGTVYYAYTDGFVTSYDGGSGIIYSDTNATPTTVVSSSQTSAGAPCLCVPILKGYYWSTANASIVLWTPVGS